MKELQSERSIMQEELAYETKLRQLECEKEVRLRELELGATLAQTRATSEPEFRASVNLPTLSENYRVKGFFRACERLLESACVNKKYWIN